MGDQTPRSLWRWPLVIAFLVVSGGVVVAAAAMAQTPWRQMPLLVLSAWVGILLPKWIEWAWSLRSRPRSRRPPARRSKQDPPGRGAVGRALEFPWTPKPVDTMSTLYSLASGVLLFIFTLISMVSDDVRSWFLPQAENGFSQATMGMLLLSGGFIGVSLLMLDAAEGGASISLDADGITVRVGRTRSRILWRDVDGITTDGDFMIVESAALTKGRARVLNGIVGHRQGREKALKLWSPQRPRATVCDMGALTVPKARLLKAVKKYWGGDIVRERPPRK